MSVVAFSFDLQRCEEYQQHLAALSGADLSDLKYLLTLRQRIVSLRRLRQKHVGRWNCGGYDGDLIRIFLPDHCLHYRHVRPIS